MLIGGIINRPSLACAPERGIHPASTPGPQYSLPCVHCVTMGPPVSELTPLCYIQRTSARSAHSATILCYGSKELAEIRFRA